MKTRTGIFGGSFNPIHIGHLALANYLCEYGGIDEVWFMVSPQNPHKEEQGLYPEKFRLHLVESAIRDYPRFKASDFEFSLPRPSYTIHTLQKLKETYPGRSFELIVGSDNWHSFHKWKDAEQIIAGNRILVYPRPGHPVDENTLPATVRLVKAPLLDISSTFIREAMAAGKDVRYFLHPEVWKGLAEGFKTVIPKR